MDFNLKCLEDTMLYIKDNVKFLEKGKFNKYRVSSVESIAKSVADKYKYDIDMVNDCLRIIYEEGWINIQSPRKDSDKRIWTFYIESITFKGYQYIESISQKRELQK